MAKKFKQGQKVYKKVVQQEHSLRVIGYKSNGKVVIENTKTGNITAVEEDDLSTQPVLSELEIQAKEMYEIAYTANGYSVNWDQCTTKNGWFALAKLYDKNALKVQLPTNPNKAEFK